MTAPSTQSTSAAYRVARATWRTPLVQVVLSPISKSDAVSRLKIAVSRKLAAPLASDGTPHAPPVGDPMVFLTIRNAAYIEHISGEGIEIGAFEHPAPLPEGCVTKYVDRYQPSEMAALFPEIDTSRLVPVDITLDLDTEGLKKIPSASQDYVIFNHVVEHVANPIAVLEEIFRVLRPGGRLAIGAPDRDCTFDKDRPVTSWDHLKREYRDGVTDVTDLHYIDFLAHVHPDLLKGGVDEIARHVEVQRSRREHPHVWTSAAFRAFLKDALRLVKIDAEWLFEATAAENGFEYFAIIQKSAPDA